MKKSEQGRTILELVSVLAIICLLGVLGVSLFQIATCQQKADSVYEDIRLIASAMANKGTRRTQRGMADALLISSSQQDGLTSFRTMRSGNRFALLDNCSEENFIMKVDGIGQDVCAILMRKTWSDVPNYRGAFWANTFNSECAGNDGTLTTDADCFGANMPEKIVFGVLFKKPNYDAAEHNCDGCYRNGVCYADGDTVDEGSCLKCSEGHITQDTDRICGSLCCVGEQECINNRCCNAEKVCGSGCCDANQECVENTCCDDIAANGAACNADACCISKNCSNGHCCAEGEVFYAGACHARIPHCLEQVEDTCTTCETGYAGTTCGDCDTGYLPYEGVCYNSFYCNGQTCSLNVSGNERKRCGSGCGGNKYAACQTGSCVDSGQCEHGGGLQYIPSQNYFGCATEDPDIMCWQNANYIYGYTQYGKWNCAKNGNFCSAGCDSNAENCPSWAKDTTNLCRTNTCPNGDPVVIRNNKIGCMTAEGMFCVKSGAGNGGGAWYCYDANDYKCGERCTVNGVCQEGICSISQCPSGTQLKHNGLTGGNSYYTCYDPQTRIECRLAWNGVKKCFYGGSQCGTSCSDLKGGGANCTACHICQAGTYMAEGGGCTTCAAGTYSDHSNALTCTACPAGTTSPAGSTSSADCV